MAKNSIANIVLPSNPKDREAIRNAIIEGANSMVRIDAEKDHIKSISDRIKDEYEIPPVLMKQMIRTYHKQNLSEIQGKTETLVEFYQAFAV